MGAAKIRGRRQIQTSPGAMILPNNRWKSPFAAVRFNAGFGGVRFQSSPRRATSAGSLLSGNQQPPRA
jgi:hypothetical protein